jgi:hypothetical protein
MQTGRYSGISVHLVLFVLGLLLFAFAGGAWWAPAEWPWRNRLMAWGLFCVWLSTAINF